MSNKICYYDEWTPRKLSYKYTFLSFPHLLDKLAKENSIQILLENKLEEYFIKLYGSEGKNYTRPFIQAYKKYLLAFGYANWVSDDYVEFERIKCLLYGEIIGRIPLPFKVAYIVTKRRRVRLLFYNELTAFYSHTGYVAKVFLSSTDEEIEKAIYKATFLKKLCEIEYSDLENICYLPRKYRDRLFSKTFTFYPALLLAPSEGARFVQRLASLSQDEEFASLLQHLKIPLHAFQSNKL